MNRPNPDKLQAQVDAWNAVNAIGTEVTCVKDDFSVVQTKTRSAAEVLSGHTAVIWLEDIRGCYDLKRVKAIKLAGVEGIESSSPVLETGALPLS
jgi:hypothetical protein